MRYKRSMKQNLSCNFCNVQIGYAKLNMQTQAIKHTRQCRQLTISRPELTTEGWCPHDNDQDSFPHVVLKVLVPDIWLDWSVWSPFVIFL